MAVIAWIEVLGFLGGLFLAIAPALFGFGPAQAVVVSGVSGLLLALVSGLGLLGFWRAHLSQMEKAHHPPRRAAGASPRRCPVGRGNP